MTNEVKTQNDLYTINLLEDTFFDQWKNPGSNENFRSIELQINSVCNADCLYCYYTNFGKELYPKEISDSERILKNLDAVLVWLIDNDYRPAVEVFTGEIFVQQVGRDALNMIYDKYKKVHPDKRIKSIMVPTNYTFILKDELIEYAEDIISKFSDIGIRVDLSASFDGKFLDSSNRPLKTVINSNGKIKEPRDDQYYNKVFEFSRRHNFGFHPMVYSNKIEEWKDNFLWFQKKLKEHDMDWKNIYLLEVRNAEWTSQQIIEFGKFMKFLIYYAWEKVGENELDYKNFLFEGRGFNILSGPLSRIGRGLGCSIQSSFYVRLGDLTVNPCHRTMYPGFEYFKFKTMDDRIVGIESVNPELMTTIYSTDFSNQPYCEQCGINNICTKGCLGAQYEVTGDLFTPIPTVCELEHVKILSMIEAYQEIGIKPWRYSDENIKSQWENMVKLKKENDIEMGGI